MLSCPVGAIGTARRNELAAVMDDFPLVVEEDVHYCGFNTLKSAGGNSYFIRHKDGNWLINTPKFLPKLADKFENLGGVRYIFMSHRDDVGEGQKFAERFASSRIIHRHDLEAQPQSEIILDGDRPIEFGSQFTILPTPGHTEGHSMLLYQKRFLFTGDTLYFNRKLERLEIWSPLWTWFSFNEQVESCARLHEYEFEWILPTHGQRVKFGKKKMQEELADAVARAEAERDPEPISPARVQNLHYYASELRKLGQSEYALKMEAKAKRIASLI